MAPGKAGRSVSTLPSNAGSCAWEDRGRADPGRGGGRSDGQAGAALQGPALVAGQPAQAMVTSTHSSQSRMAPGKAGRSVSTLPSNAGSCAWEDRGRADPGRGGGRSDGQAGAALQGPALVAGQPAQAMVRLDGLRAHVR